MVEDFRKNILNLLVELLDCAAVVEAEVGLADADAEVLLVGVVACHLALLVGDESVVVDMVGLRAAQHGAFVAHFWIGVDGEEVEIGFAAQGADLAGGAYAFDDAVASRRLRLLVELLNNPRWRVLGAQVVAYQRHSVAVNIKSPTFDFLGDESPYGIVHEAALFDEIVDDGAFAGAQSSSNANGNHIDVYFFNR